LRRSLLDAERVLYFYCGRSAIFLSEADDRNGALAPLRIPRRSSAAYRSSSRQLAGKALYGQAERQRAAGAVRRRHRRAVIAAGKPQSRTGRSSPPSDQSRAVLITEQANLPVDRNGAPVIVTALQRRVPQQQPAACQAKHSTDRRNASEHPTLRSCAHQADMQPRRCPAPTCIIGSQSLVDPRRHTARWERRLSSRLAVDPARCRVGAVSASPRAHAQPAVRRCIMGHRLAPEPRVAPRDIRSAGAPSPCRLTVEPDFCGDTSGPPLVFPGLHMIGYDAATAEHGSADRRPELIYGQFQSWRPTPTSKPTPWAARCGHRHRAR